MAPRPGLTPLIVLSVALAALCPAGPALAAEPDGTIEVTVRDQAGAPVPRATVRIARGAETGYVRVDESGRGRFAHPTGVPLDFCGAARAGPAHPPACARGVVVGPGETRAVELAVEVPPFEAWVAAFAGPDWLRGFRPFWVQNHVPDATLWSGPDADAVAFGTRRQWSRFLVAGPPVGGRLYVLDEASKDYAWIDAAAVGPSGPPPAGPFPAA